MSHLQTAHFWESDKDPILRRTRWRKRVLWLLLLTFLTFLGWVVWESLRAFAIF